MPGGTLHPPPPRGRDDGAGAAATPAPVDKVPETSREAKRARLEEASPPSKLTTEQERRMRENKERALAIQARARVPTDVWRRIFAALPRRDLKAVRGTCRAFLDALPTRRSIPLRTANGSVAAWIAAVAVSKECRIGLNRVSNFRALLETVKALPHDTRRYDPTTQIWAVDMEHLEQLVACMPGLLRHPEVGRCRLTTACRACTLEPAAGLAFSA